jgi:hypothetical protein
MYIFTVHKTFDSLCGPSLQCIMDAIGYMEGDPLIWEMLGKRKIRQCMERYTKSNGLNPYEYLRFIFKNLPGVQFGQHPEFLEDYLS